MKKWKVTVEICNYDPNKIGVDKTSVITRTITIEAGNKKLAGLRALSEIGKTNKEMWKSIKSIEEVRQ